jgi:peptidase E
MKLLLTSAGFSNKEIFNTFLKLIDKPMDQVRLVFIPTASRTKDELKYVNKSRQELVDFGIKNITTLNLDHKITNENLINIDVIYVCGGNTFYLLQKIRESGFDQILPNFKGLYIGVSAGSIVVGPDIKVSNPYDKNDTNLTNTAGLNIVDLAIAPHYQRKNKTIFEKLKKQVNYDIVGLTDNQAVLVNNGKKIIIGQP